MADGDYQIIAFDDKIARLTVLYNGALFPVALDLPVAEDGSVPDDELLDKWIMDRVPKELVERKRLLENGIPNADKIRDLVRPIIQPPTPRPQEEIDRNWKANIEGAVLMILKETRVIEE